MVQKNKRKKYLPPLVSGDAIIGFGITEPDAGSDVTMIKTKAEKKGDIYVINGSKMFITNGCLADYMLVYALTHPEENKIHNRFSVILVETSTPGYEATKIHGKLGIRASNTAEVSLNNVEVPVENIVGHEKRGFYQLMDFFNKTRNHVAAQGVGVAQGALEMAISHVKKRKAFRGTLSSCRGFSS